ncbi:MAG: orotidine-5'-phosphate decarboxylase [Oscillospiraceae bacterium]|jgi:orotidine-5'-phosphate decarboxylase|nr:orotidine-5'-phosphate decarboxylase [Oscillospiraceae bacterium]
MSIDRLTEKIREKKNPTVAGLDARIEYVPEFIQRKNAELYGKTLKAAAESVYEFNAGLIDALCEVVPAVKPQSAYYELLGPDGAMTLKRTIAYAREKGLYVITDGKRNDIGETASAYADAYFGGVSFMGESFEPYSSDGLTVNAYLGSDGIKPFVKYCEDGKSIFVLVKTSNKSSFEVQEMIAGDRPLYRVMAEYINRWGADCVGQCGYSNVAAVVGATHPRQLKELRQAHPRIFFLVPGYGAQGGGAADVEHAFDGGGGGAVINSSRGIMCAWQKTDGGGKNFKEAAYDAAVKMKRDLQAYVVVA